MNLLRALLASSFAVVLVSTSPIRAADAVASPAGYWEGTITLPNRELEIRVELAPPQGNVWKGTIDIPLQGLRGFALEPVKVTGPAVELGLPGIPGDPRLNGKMAADGKTIEGDFTQGGGSMPFRLERKPKPAATKPVDETPAQGVAGKGLAGNWRGSLKPLPGIELRLSLELAPDAAGKLEGVLVSLDQGNARIPVSGLAEDAGTVRFETPNVNGSFEGKFNADGSEITGTWTQMGRSTPLVFKRLPAAKR